MIVMPDMMKFIVHDQPVLRGENNYIARIWLHPFGLDGEIEQVWLRRLPGGDFTMCCIPFRAYGLALRDTVRISSDGSTVVEVVERSGNRVLRALFEAEPAPDQIRAAAAGMKEQIRRLGLLFEWSGDRHVAIDVPVDVDSMPLLEYLTAKESAGRLYWEWNDVVPFEAGCGHF